MLSSCVTQYVLSVCCKETVAIALLPHRVLDVLLVLDGPAGGSHRLSKAKASFQCQANLRALLHKIMDTSLLYSAD